MHGKNHHAGCSLGGSRLAWWCMQVIIMVKQVLQQWKQALEGAPEQSGLRLLCR